MHEDLKRKIMMMMAFRMVIIITLLGSAILIQLVSRTILPINPLYFLIFLTSFLTLLYAFAYNRMNNLELLAYLQLSGDILVITLLIYFTGGVRSSFSFLFILAVIIGSILLYRKGSIYVATISGFCYASLVLLLYYGVIPYYDLSPEEISGISSRETYYWIFWHIVAFCSVALLSSYLSERLKRSDTALQEIDDDLSDLKILHEKIIESLRSGLIMADLEGQINFVNGAGAQILGLPAHRILSLTIQRLFKEDVQLDAIKEHLEKNALYPLERSSRDDERLIGMNISYLHSKKGMASGLLVVYQDITESRKLERQFRLQERMIAMGTMAAGIAHEIRNPLAAIRGSIQMLRNELDLSDEQRQLMEIVLTESLRLDQTIQNFLNFAKPKPPEKERNDLKKIVGDMLGFIEKSPEFREDHQIVFSKSMEIFEHDFDCNQLKQVIWNLSINALRAMPEGGVLEVSLEHDLYGNTLLSFRDEGNGIEPDRLDSIFDPFQDSTTGGSGLGMAIVYRIVQDHNGQITINSKPGHGTIITVCLPAKANEMLQPLLQ